MFTLLSCFAFMVNFGFRYLNWCWRWGVDFPTSSFAAYLLDYCLVVGDCLLTLLLAAAVSLGYL